MKLLQTLLIITILSSASNSYGARWRLFSKPKPPPKPAPRVIVPEPEEPVVVDELPPIFLI